MKKTYQPKESSVVRECLEVLQLLGIFAWRNNTGAISSKKGFVRFGLRGSADIIGICPDGRFLAIECKRSEGGRLSIWQRNFLDSVSYNNGVAIIAHSAAELHDELISWGVIFGEEQGVSNE